MRAFAFSIHLNRCFATLLFRYSLSTLVFPFRPVSFCIFSRSKRFTWRVLVVTLLRQVVRKVSFVLLRRTTRHFTDLVRRLYEGALLRDTRKTLFGQADATCWVWQLSDCGFCQCHLMIKPAITWLPRQLYRPKSVFRFVKR